MNVLCQSAVRLQAATMVTPPAGEYVRFEVSLTTPKVLGGPGGNGANPTMLFAARYAACFLGTMKFVASHGPRKVPIDAMATVAAGIGPREQVGFDRTVNCGARGPTCRGRNAGRQRRPGAPLFQRGPQQHRR